jgi:hypothetical protein
MRVFGPSHGLLVVALCPWWSASAAEAPIGDGALCRIAIAAAEEQQHIPDGFLSAIAKVESGRPLGGMVVPWPWTINAEGVGSFFATKTDAIAAVQALQARGVRSIDVGCMQVNLQQHPDAFPSLEQAFDPGVNAHYAAGLLLSLFGQMGSWPLAAAAYHSQTPTLGAAYQRQVLAAWAEPDRPANDGTKPRAADAHEPAQAGAMSASGGTPMPFSAFGRQTGLMAGEQPHAGVAQTSGRGLADYRQMPTQLAFKMPGKAS